MKIPLESTLQLAEVLCRQLAACKDLPDDLKCLVVRPPPKRFTSIVETEPIVCDPEGSAVPSEDRVIPSGDHPVQCDTNTVQSVDGPSESNYNTATNRHVPSNDGGPSAVQAVPIEDMLQSAYSTTSCNDV